MNRIKIRYGETFSPKRYESKRLDIGLETEIENPEKIKEKAEELFRTAKEIINQQKV